MLQPSETDDENSVALLRRQPQDRLLALTARRALTWIFGDIGVGSLKFVLPDGSVLYFEGGEPGPAAELIYTHYRGIFRILARGDIGFSEGFIRGDWSTPDLSRVIHFGALNIEHFEAQMGVNRLAAYFQRLGHALQRNSRRGAKSNIHAHYDIGNPFYRLWLDPSMTYSSGVYERGANDLETAQRDKYAQLADLLELDETHHMLEIGCGWGGFAEYAAAERGARVTGITISEEQLEFSQKRMKDKGLDGQVEIKLCDYRDVRGTFDRIASIEMFEAVGERYWPAFFSAISQRLRPGGIAGVQTIIVPDDRFSGYRQRTDFIQRYIFPGGMIGADRVLREEFRKAGLTAKEMLRFGQSYARTLATWHENFNAKWDEIKALGFDQRFRNMWEYYLSYCEGGFAGEILDVAQYKLEKQA